MKIICDELDADFDEVTTVTEDRVGKDFAYLMDSTKSRLDLGWDTKFSFSDGIIETIDWVKENLDEINTMSLDYMHKE